MFETKGYSKKSSIDNVLNQIFADTCHCLFIKTSFNTFRDLKSDPICKSKKT